MRNFSISIILVLIVLKDYQTSALSLNCVQCENCPEEITDFSNSEPCETQCAVYKNENNQIDRGCFVSAENIMLVCPGDNCNYKRIPTCDQCTTLDDCITTVCDRENDECYAGKFDKIGAVERGCQNSMNAVTTIRSCNSPRCNIDRVPICEKCSDLTQCTPIACDHLGDECYASKSDERRGCTSDSVYDSTSADFETCSTNRCNRVVQCVKCDSNEATHSNCLNEPETFIAPCEKHGTIKEDNCYRHVDGEQFQLGCISDINFPPTCGDQGYPCRKCEDDNCNAKDFQKCYVCSDNTNCADVQTSQNTLICAEYNSECFMAYTYSTKMIERGCLEDLQDTIYGDIVVTCATPYCNQEEFPDKSTHLKCYQDTLGKVEYCKSPDATKCFTLEDESGNSLRGCNTDDGFAELCREGDNCVVCDTSECNSPTECVICSGSESCRDEPLKRACAESKLSNECYTYLDKGNLEKGCLGELMNGDTTSNVYEACSSDNSLCNKCFGPHCNEVHCLKCDSAEDDTCVEGDPDSIAFEACLPDDRCLMFKDAQGYTKRGCSSNFDGSDGEGTDAGYNFGLVPSGAIKCYQCTEDCVDTDESQLKYCSSNSVLGCYYIFDGVSITSRGCLSEEGLDCDGDQYCNSCTGTDGCNSNTIIECYHCSFDEATQDCITSGSTETCSTTGDCVVYIDNEGKFVRGCESDLPTEATCAKTCSDNLCNKNDVCDASIDCYGICSAVMPEEKCVRYQNVNQVHMGCNEFREEICDLDDEHCYVCDQNLCNRAAVAECYDCTNCPIIEPQHRTILCENINDNCYTATENPSGQVIRGCFGDKKDELTGLETCVGAACNKAPLVEGNSCYQCTNCSTTDGRTPTSCGNPRFEGCYTAQDLTERTISRGCKTDADYSEKCQKFNCLECVGEDCNTDQVRPQPLWCSSCFKADCFDYTAPKPCKEGMLVDYCIEYVVFNIPFYKGCLSDDILPEIESDCNGDERFCKLCDKNYCNTPNLSCYECTSTSLQGFDCITRPDILGNTKECGGLAHCYTSVDKETGVLSRGCSIEGTAECIEGPLCKSCQDHNCNVDVVPNDRLYCYQCEGLNCLNPTNSEPCQIYEADQECFTYAEDAITVYRGCSNDNFARQCGEKPCVFCPGRGCNDEPTIVPNTLSCIQCIRNSDCDGKAFGEKCTKDLLLGRSDSCYTQYHSTAVPIEKGCLSDLTESHPCMQGSLNCNICSGDDCNRGKAICYKCDSEQDNDCSQISNETFTSECTGECVTLVDDYTKRGCIEDFPELEVVNCENSEYCEICQGKQCNSGILPDTRTQCYVCEGSECVEPSAELLKACTRYRKDDHCYTNVVNASWVQRDCWSSLENENCGDYCQSCVVPGCNSQGVMQPNTLTCIKCEDGECVGKVDGSKCTSPIMLGRQDWCYTFESKGKLSKGCLSDLEENESIKDACTNDVDELCVVCSNDNCNGDFPYCITCDSENDASCGGYLAKVPDSMRTLCKERNCITYVDENGYTRKGCADETNFCEDKEHCVECAEPMCNNAAFPEGRILCHQCENCGLDRPIGAPLTCRQYDASDSCYVDVTDLSITRGCVSDAQVTCDPDSCLTCTTNGCNDQPYEYESSLSCIQCLGARNCESASVPAVCDGLTILGQADECFSLEVNGEVIQKGCRRTLAVDCEEPDCNTCSCNECNFANKKDITCAKCSGNDCGNAILGRSICTGCISYVSRDGIVSRGCLEDFQNECSSFGSKHKTCFADNCNINIFPEDRILCHRCENCLENIGSPEICPTYVENDNCYTAQSVDGQSVSRGCQSELLTNCVEPLCSLCDESGCNSRNPLDPGTTETPEITPTSTVTNEITTTLSNEVSTTPAPTFLPCLRCQESSDDASCAWGFQKSAAEQCSSEHATGCFTCQKDSLTIRGCSSEDTQSSCTLEPETCRGDGCNNKNHRTQRCADGTGSSYTVKDCEGIVEYDKRGCYILRSGLGVVVNRGCYAKLTEEQIQTCNTDRNMCYICTEDGCNSGFMVRVLNSLIVIVVVLGLARNITL